MHAACPSRRRFASCMLLAAAAALPAPADSWPMKHRDFCHTGRADFVVPPERQDAAFFSVPAWQKPSPGSPADGDFSSGSMVFFDGAGPAGSDIVVGGYHWPKGVQAMHRRTGRRFWFGNPSGGETIGASTPAFSNNGAALFAVNDATNSAQFPEGHPFMAFSSVGGPAAFRHNGLDPAPWQLSAHSPTIAPDGRIFLHAWVDRPYAGADLGNRLTRTWSAATANGLGLADPSLYWDGTNLTVISAGRGGLVTAHAGDTGDELWSVVVPTVDATATIDPLNGNIYIPAGDDSIYVVGLDAAGLPLWLSPAEPVYIHVPGENSPQRAQSAGCLSHDGATFYFQTNSQTADGRLYAITTATGRVKWSFETHGTGWEMVGSSPIVTPNGVVIVGNNDGNVYHALRDDGAQATLLDTFAVAADGNARCTPALSADGLLYLPLRTTWTTGNADGDTPTFDVQNVFTAFDLNEGASTILPAPAYQVAVALNRSVEVSWRAISDPNGVFDHYAIYRSTQPFTSVEGMTPVATVADINTTRRLDYIGSNGTGYYYAVTSVSVGGGEQTAVNSTGPRTPRDEDDLQVVSISRTPRYPRYDPTYTVHLVTEPSGFGPYYFSAATGLGSGQNPNTQRWPNNGQQVTYTATLRNRGTNYWANTIRATWRVDGTVAAGVNQSVVLLPGETRTFALPQIWDNQLHDISFTLDNADDRPANNALTVNSKSVAFLTYADISFLEDFREVHTPGYPQAVTDDLFDWLNHHIARFNEMFAAAGTEKRLHYGILQQTRDGDPDPDIDRISFAIFPFRYHHADANPRLPGYYHANVDIDYGLLHEMGHQLGLIDLYQLNIDPGQNQVSNSGYSAVACLMNGVSPFLSEHSARAMTHWLHKAHGYYGQYMYSMPQQVRVRILGMDGQPLPAATVTVYQLVERPGVGKVISSQVKAQGVTNAAGEYTLPNVPINPQLVPMTYAGDTLRPNPFGYVAVVGTNGILLLQVEHEGFTDYAWLEITEVNNAYWRGQTQTATFDRQVNLGGTLQRFPPADMTELNAASWAKWAQDGAVILSDSTDMARVGRASLRVVATGGFDNYVRYPGDQLAIWDLTRDPVLSIRLWCFANNRNGGGFQSRSPWIRLGGNNGYFEWRPATDRLNEAIGQWREFIVPISGNSNWPRATFGSPSLDEVNYLELHADTWGAGFTLWLDGVGFQPNPATSPCDANCDGSLNSFDIQPFVDILVAPDLPACSPYAGDANADGSINQFDIQGFVDCLAAP